MSEPGTPLPWYRFDEFMVLADKNDLKVCDTEFGESLDARKDAAYIVEACNAYPQLRAALRKLVEQAKYLTPCGDDLQHDCCDSFIERGHADHCAFAAAIAEAERLLGPTSGS